MTRRRVLALTVLLVVLFIGLGALFVQRQHQSRSGDPTELMLEDLEARAPEVRARAEEQLSKLNADVLPVLVQILATSNSAPTKTEGALKTQVQNSMSRERMRRQAIRAFEVLGQKARPVVPDLLRMIEQTNQTYAAARALAGIGAVTELRGFQNSDRPELRKDVASALGHVTGKDQEAIEAILVATADSDPVVRAAAMGSLGQLRKQPDRAVPVLVKGMKDPQSAVRSAAAKSLGKFGVHAESALTALEAARQDTDPQVRRAARQAVDLIHLEKP